METDKRNLKLDDELVNEIESLKSNDQENKKPEKKKKWVLTIIIGIVIIGAGIFYYLKALSYKNVFFPNTYINNIDVSGMTAENVSTLINNQVREYSAEIRILEREPEIISSSDVNLSMNTGDGIEKCMASQNIWLWPECVFKARELDVPAVTELDDAMLEQFCAKLDSFDDANANRPVDAKVGGYDEATNSYPVVPEYNGNIITDKEKAIALIKDSVTKLEPEIDLEREDIYSQATVKQDDPVLLERKKELDSFVKAEITYPGHGIVLDGKTLSSWIINDASGKLSYDEEKIRNFVSMLASAYDTLGKERKLVTQYGNETVVSGGDFGWLVDQDAETEEIRTILEKGEVVEREPEFSSRAVSFEESDWGDTYVEINLAKQQVFFVKEGKLIVLSDCVSGGLQRKAPTPTGVYDITYKARNAVLRGPRRSDGSYQWESPVSYWMPFNNGIGLHDATWRGSFGGTIYKVNGSHGCVNLPLKKAAAIYEVINTGTPVIVYDDDFEIMNMPLDPEDEAKKKAAEEKELQKKIEAEAKKAKKVPDSGSVTTAETKSPVITDTTESTEQDPGQEQEVPVQEPQTESQQQETETVPVDWGPGYDRGIEVPDSQPSGPGYDSGIEVPDSQLSGHGIDVAEPEITVNAENLAEVVE